LFFIVAITILFWDLNLAGVLVSMGMEMEMEKEKRGHPLGWWIVWIDGWMDGCLVWLRDTLGLCFSLSFVELELDFPLCDERGGDGRCRF
jgi:hypothetical protein